MKNKKGFTLIELLAVIVILAIIALIATPIILNMINDARKSAAVDSAYGYIEAIDYNNSMAQLNSDKYDKINSGSVTEINNDVKVKGTKPTSGDITVDASGRVIGATLCINGYNIEYKGEKATATDDKCRSDSETGKIKYTVYSDGTAIYYNPVEGKICSDYTEEKSKTGTKTGCMKFYIFNDEGEDASKVNMILDHSTTAKVAYNSTSPLDQKMVEVKNALESDTKGWVGNPRLIKADEVAKITGADKELKWSSSLPYTNLTPEIGTSISYYYFDGIDGSDTTWKTQIANKTTKSKYAWLYEYTMSCISHGCNIEDSSTLGYWTSTPTTVATDMLAWAVNGYGNLLSILVYADTGYGVRPVITIDKSIIS